MKPILFFCLTLCSISGMAQFNAVEREDQLNELLDTLRNAKDDEAKKTANAELDRLMELTLNEPTIFDISFTKLKTIGIIDSPDGLVRIVNWNVELTDDQQQYNGYVITRSAIGKEPRVVKLNYVRDIYNPKPTEVVDDENWYGALYYDIIPYGSGSKASYILLGWNGAGMNSNMKLIDAMTFTSKGVKFGQSIFKTKDQTLKRVFLEHSSKSVISLKYEEEYNRIIFDHLSPENPSMVGFYEYYVPDMSYDAFIFGGNKLTLKEDVIGINQKVKTIQKGTKMDPKSGEIVMETVKNEWIDPSSATGGTHVAAMPEEISETDADKEAKKTEKAEGEPKTALERWEGKRHHKNETPTNGVLQEPKKKKRN